MTDKPYTMEDHEKCRRRVEAAEENAKEERQRRLALQEHLAAGNEESTFSFERWKQRQAEKRAREAEQIEAMARADQRRISSI